MRRMMAVAVLAAAGACGSSSDPITPAPFDPGGTYTPDVSAAALSPEITNPLFPAPVGARWVYDAEQPDGVEHIEVVVQAETRMVNGAVARVVRDTVTFNGEMIEDTFDWYAQDADGNVWYLGEDTAEYENGVVVSTAGAWEWGQRGALPGIIMLGHPEPRATYRQEYLAGEAEDYAEVDSLDETVTSPAGTFTHCLKTHDRSAVEAALDEHKYYCPGVGIVWTDEGDVQEKLTEFSGVSP